MSVAISYYALYRSDDHSQPPGGLMVNEVSIYRTRTLFFDHETHGWVLNSAVGTRLLWNVYLDEDDRSRKVSRQEAEEIAQSLGGELPGEEELHQIVLDSEKGKGLPPLARDSEPFAPSRDGDK
jgi:hypothetical protein